jgi:magnesium transporter
MSAEPFDLAVVPTGPAASDGAPVNDLCPGESDSLDAENRLKGNFVRRVRDALEAGDVDRVYALVEPLHPADTADLFELIDPNDRVDLARAISDLMGGEVFAEMNDHVRDALVEDLPAEDIADIAEEMETDDAVALLEDLEPAEQRAILAEMEPEERAAIESALAYPEETAGRLMSRDVIAVGEHMTVGDLIDFLREERELATEFWEVFIVDPRYHPVGTCALSWILRSPRDVPLADVMQRDQTLIPVTMDQEEVALRFQKYSLISAAVVDADGRLVGQITVDDIVHIIQEEAGEDALALSGAGDGDINQPLHLTIRSRMWWLFINLGTAILASSVVAVFEGTIERLVTLAVIMPIISGMGGNAATQTMAVTVRALATNQLTSSNTLRMIAREWWIASANGFGLGALMAIATQVIYHDPWLSLVVVLAMVLNSLNAGLSGVLIPLGLQKLKIDPAVVSTVFVTTMTDTFGFFFFLGLATLFHLH